MRNSVSCVIAGPLQPRAELHTNLWKVILRGREDLETKHNHSKQTLHEKKVFPEEWRRLCSARHGEVHHVSSVFSGCLSRYDWCNYVICFISVWSGIIPFVCVGFWISKLCNNVIRSEDKSTRLEMNWKRFFSQVRTFPIDSERLECGKWIEDIWCVLCCRIWVVCLLDRFL